MRHRSAREVDCYVIVRKLLVTVRRWEIQATLHRAFLPDGYLYEVWRNLVRKVKVKR
jgi:hypothetical protein